MIPLMAFRPALVHGGQPSLGQRWRPARPVFALAVAVALALALSLPLAAEAGKRSSGVTVQAELPAKLRAGDVTRLQLHVSGVTASDGATIEVRDVSTREVLFSARLRQGEHRSIELPYRLAREGVQYVDVLTRQAERASIQSVAISAGQGPVALKSEGRRLVTPSGETLIALPAR